MRAGGMRTDKSKGLHMQAKLDPTLEDAYLLLETGSGAMGEVVRLGVYLYAFKGRMPREVLQRIEDHMDQAGMVDRDPNGELVAVKSKALEDFGSSVRRTVASKLMVTAADISKKVYGR